MKKLKISCFLVVLVLSFGLAPAAQAEPKWSSWLGWNKSYDDFRQAKAYNYHLEDARHLQITQWAHEDWYVEDWTSQTDGMTLIKGWYAADILRKQKEGHAGLPVLVVGPNFYHLSGLDKRRVVTTVDVVYGMTEKTPESAFLIEDWDTKMPIGVFDQYGLRLH